MAEGEAWADYAIFETMDDLNDFLKSAEESQANGTNDLAEKNSILFLTLILAKATFFL